MSEQENLNKSDTDEPGGLEEKKDFLDLSITFDEFGKRYLDNRLTRALTKKLRYTYPTHVQINTIPLILQKKDCLVQAKTGSGKTLTYAIPLIQSCLSSNNQMTVPPFFGCVFVPLRELASQVASVLSSLCEFCHAYITIRDTSCGMPRLVSDTLPSILVSTPKAFLTYLYSKEKQMDVDKVCGKNSSSYMRTKIPTALKDTHDLRNTFRKNLRVVVLDEADALLNLGFNHEIDVIFNQILKSPNVGERQYQVILCSATLTDEVLKLKSMILYKPAVVKLKEPENHGETMPSENDMVATQPSKRLSEFYLSCPSMDKCLVIYSLFKLSLVPLKSIVFVNSSERAYTLSILLRRFGIVSSVLSETMPFSTRNAILTSFQQGVSNIMIAVDIFSEKIEETNEDTYKSEPLPRQEDHDAGNTESMLAARDDDNVHSKTTVNEAKGDGRKKKGKSKIIDTGVHRGVDFKGVRCVINFDVPSSVKSYIHRIGRTARAGVSGVALTLCGSDKSDEVKLLDTILTVRNEGSIATSVKPLGLDLNDIECFRYRVEDVLQSITPKVISSVCAQDIQRELLCSKRLKEHFEANPDDARALKNAFKSVQIVTQHDRHLKYIPSYFRSSVSRLKLPNPIIDAVSRASQHESGTEAEARKKTSSRRHHQSTDILRELALRKKKRHKSFNETIVKNLDSEPQDYGTTPLSSLPIISGRKLQKLHKNKTKLKTKK